MPDLNIKSETLDKGIDLIADSTKETRSILDNKTAGGLRKLLELLKSTNIGIKMDTYIAERPYKLEKAMKKMKEKYDKIPDENKVEPSSYIALKGIQELNYCLDEEHLKEMFSNLLVSDMDSRNKNKVLPSFIEIIKQLNKADAEFLTLLNENGNNFYSIELLLHTNNTDGYSRIGQFAIFNFPKDSTAFTEITLDEIVLNNLERLGLIKVRYDEWYTENIQKYDTLFNNLKSRVVIPENKTLDYSKGLVKLTKLGEVFTDICLS
ncbi:MAG: DUF4393 domain-containing protein [Clostridia bacterium]|nr:DUF4393 domain-containing protein [Clostridia bacterium]